MKPNKPGIWEWFDENKRKRLVNVVDAGFEDEPYLRVYFNGGYYDVTKEFDEEEWPNRWGKFVAPPHTIPLKNTYYTNV